jgi:hypothetical protein
VGSGRAAAYLAKRHPGLVQEITGLTMVYEDNEVQKRKTFWENLRSALEVPENVRQKLRDSLAPTYAWVTQRYGIRWD